MVFGVPQSVRYPFKKPSQASANWRPPVPMTRATYVSENFHPFTRISTSGMPVYEPRTNISPGRMIGPAPRALPEPAAAPMGAAAMMRGSRGLNPTATMRLGTFPRVGPNASNVRRLATHAGQAVASVHPYMRAGT